MIDKLNEDFIVLRASRRTDGRAEGCVKTLGFDWQDADSDALIDKLNATHAHLLSDVCKSVAVRGKARPITKNDPPGIAAWSKGRLRTNYQFYLLSPQGKAIDLEYKEREPKGAPYWRVSWTSRFVMPRLLGERGNEQRINWSVGKADQGVILHTLDKVSKMYPGKRDAKQRDRLAIPWHKDASFAVRGAKRDQKRIVIVPATATATGEARIDPRLEKLLSDQAVLKRFSRAYSFLKLDPATGGAADLQSKLESLNNTGLIIAAIPGPDCEVKWTGHKHALTKIIKTARSLNDKAALMKLLAEHAVSDDDPTWKQLSKTERGR